MTNQPPSPPFDLDAAMTRFLAEESAYKVRAAEVRPANKAALFDALAAAGITLVVVSFDGYGDSGQIQSIEAKAGDTAAPLPSGEITITLVEYGRPETARQTFSLAAAIEHMAYDFLQQTHAGWQDNDGAYGDFIFDTTQRSITLDYNERYTETENFTHEF